MLPLGIRGKLFARSFRAKDQAFAEVPLITWMDIALIPKIGAHGALRLKKRFELYRQNIGTDSWTSLTNIYPRAYYVFYYLLLFWWADYCRCLPSLLSNPRPSLIPELFVRYVVEIDRLIDTPDGPALLEKPSSLKLSRSVLELHTELLDHIWSADLLPQTKRNICHLIWTFRQNSLMAVQMVSRSRKMDLSSLYAVKQHTTGGLFHAWAQLLAILYSRELSEAHADNVLGVIYQLAMAIQIMDDMMDFPEDYAAGVPNIFYELLKSDPKETGLAIEHVEKINWNHLDLTWAEEHLPSAYKAALGLIDSHMKEAVDTSIDTRATTEMCQIISKLLDHPVGV